MRHAPPLFSASPGRVGRTAMLHDGGDRPVHEQRQELPGDGFFRLACPDCSAVKQDWQATFVMTLQEASRARRVHALPVVVPRLPQMCRTR